MTTSICPPIIPGMTYTGKRYGRFAREVRDTLTGKLCVVKGPFVHSADDSRFAHEARVLELLSMEGVIGLRECFRERRRCWLVFDRFSGAKPFPSDRAGWLVARLSKILEQCHNRGWAHCDVCPGNILVKGSQLCLLDFGAALALGQRFPLRRQVRPVWSSPSLLTGKGRVSPTDDVYSLLLLSCYLLSGQTAPVRKDFSRSARALDRPNRLSRRQWHFLQQALECPERVTIQDLAIQALGW